jgi:hypothetical protein
VARHFEHQQVLPEPQEAGRSIFQHTALQRCCRSSAFFAGGRSKFWSVMRTDGGCMQNRSRGPTLLIVVIVTSATIPAAVGRPGILAEAKHCRLRNTGCFNGKSLFQIPQSRDDWDGLTQTRMRMRLLTREFFAQHAWKRGTWSILLWVASGCLWPSVSHPTCWRLQSRSLPPRSTPRTGPHAGHRTPGQLW